jgi:hypothetical protein
MSPILRTGEAMEEMHSIFAFGANFSSQTNIK